MSVKIRFTRLGKTKSPFYRIVVMDSRKPRDSEYLDKVGHFNPLVKREERSPYSFHLDREKVISWLKKGAQPTQVVLDLLKEEKVWEEFAFANQKLKKKKSRKRKSHSNPVSDLVERREKKKKQEEKQRSLAAKSEKTKQEESVVKEESVQEQEETVQNSPTEATETTEAKQEDPVVSEDSPPVQEEAVTDSSPETKQEVDIEEISASKTEEGKP